MTKLRFYAGGTIGFSSCYLDEVSPVSTANTLNEASIL